jgi:threonine synthase
VHARLSLARRQSARWVLAATAHPAKFSEIVEPLIGRKVAVPESLGRLFELPSRAEEIAADVNALRQGLEER